MTRRVVGQVHMHEAGDEARRRALAAALCQLEAEIDGAVASHAGAHLDGSVGGGEITWDLLFESQEAADAWCARLAGSGPEVAVEALDAAAGKRIASIELARLETLEGGLARPGLVGVKRTLWLRVLPEAAAAAVAVFERETPLLASAIPAIRNWRWSRVAVGASSPMSVRWTHVWEQEFETLAGLEVDYMSSPCHWGYVDRFFDPEMPERVVDLWLSHLYCPASAPVLSWESDS